MNGEGVGCDIDDACGCALTQAPDGDIVLSRRLDVSQREYQGEEK